MSDQEPIRVLQSFICNTIRSRLDGWISLSLSLSYSHSLLTHSIIFAISWWLGNHIDQFHLKAEKNCSIFAIFFDLENKLKEIQKKNRIPQPWAISFNFKIDTSYCMSMKS